MTRQTIDDQFQDPRDTFSTMKSAVKTTFISAGVGAVVGAVVGVGIGESINEYAEALHQAPAMIHYAVDGVAAMVCGGIGAGVFGVVAHARGMYRVMQKF